ncbi:NAD(+) diphosphatase [Sulfurospirillum diekertiae]|uniref:NAD(+) diphosphatase n=1 Tax=Sulfurospirillum diekertiae TaxID=1854492 RepID=A0A290HEZ6_9BACT|nr:NAD(+) diphosphatase [Sulfurospirillum diekertiae]ATB70007.1 NADH pyrophosphatase [Sulfurospirillum diekertiae]QIR75062.2 NAD(+) diphosphatase [Sulfurospirillum diekertiae]QIR77725.2 NAD(+) diphosphatase [Sulfurospirillum diekertiae]
MFEHTISVKLTPLFVPTDGKQSVIIGFCGDALLMAVDGSLPKREHFELLGKPHHSFHIGEVHDDLYSLLVWKEDITLPEHLVKTNLREFLDVHPPHLYAMLARAKQLAHWLYDNQYCGRCGDPIGYSPKFSALTCKTCGFTIFPRLSPACIVLITRGDEILLARSPYFTSGMYSLLAGFVEAGESVEDAVHREIYEEVGIRVKNLRYFGSQPWPFPHSLMIGFFAEYESGELRLQPEEIEDAKWFTKDHLPQLPKLATISGIMINAWLKDH